MIMAEPGPNYGEKPKIDHMADREFYVMYTYKVKLPGEGREDRVEELRQRMLADLAVGKEPTNWTRALLCWLIDKWLAQEKVGSTRVEEVNIQVQRCDIDWNPGH